MVAVKCIDLNKHGFDKKSLDGEIKTYKALADKFQSCPFVLQMINIYQTTNSMYIIMELAEGGDLEDPLQDRLASIKEPDPRKQRNPNSKGSRKKMKRQDEPLWAHGRGLKESEAIKILYQVIAGLAFMNKNNVYHRDIKPANIMYDKVNDIYKLTDYGLAKVVGYNNKTFTLLGTPLYQAPEIWHFANQPRRFQGAKGARAYTANIDTFSVGVMIYELLYLKTPWPA